MLPHLMDDFDYRAQVINQNCAYNQPPHLGYNPRATYPYPYPESQVDPQPDPDPVSADLAYSPTEKSVVLGETFTAPTLSNPHKVTVTYSSSNTSVATVNSQGTVTVVGAGNTTITASFAGNKEYLAGNASYKLTVTEPEPGTTGITNHKMDADGNAVIYNSQGVRLTKIPAKGIYFIGNKKYVAH